MHVWTPESGGGPAVLVLQEIFGVGPYIKAVAERLAEAGYVVGAPDVFWRFAPGWESTHDQDGLTASLAQVGKLDPPTAIGDCVTALGVLAIGKRLRHPSGRDRVLSGRHAGVGRRCRRWSVAPASATTDRACAAMLDGIDAGRLPDPVPLRQRRRIHPERRRRGDQRRDRRTRRASCSTSRTPGTPSTTTRARCSTTSRPHRRRGPRRWHSWPNTCRSADQPSNRPGWPGLGLGCSEPEVLVGGGHRDPPAWGAGDHALLDQERLVHVFDRVGLLADADRDRGQPDRAAVELLAHRRQDRPVDLVEPEVVDAEQRQPLAGDVVA